MKFLAAVLVLFAGVSFYQPDRPMELPASEKIDSTYAQIWKEKNVQPAPLSSDEEFLRRIYLDLTGRIPTEERARAFLESTNPSKRSLLIQALLRSDAYAEYFSSLWT